MQERVPRESEVSRPADERARPPVPARPHPAGAVGGRRVVGSPPPTRPTGVAAPALTRIVRGDGGPWPSVPADPRPATRIQRATSVTAGVVQRRVPLWGDVAHLMETGDRAAHERGLNTAIDRTFADLTPEQRATAEEKMAAVRNHPNYRPDREVELWTKVVNTLRDTDGEPAANYEGGAKRFVTPTGAERQKLLTTATQSATALRTVAAGAGTRELVDIFGGDPQDGWKAARDRFDESAAWLEKLAREDKVGANLSGEPEEMGYLGKTTFHNEIHLNRSAWKELSSPTDWHDLFIALVHESFHAAHSDVNDNGGYKADAKSFRTRSAAVKYRNASHYEEVFRRLFKIHPVGGVFTPYDPAANDPDAPDVVGLGYTDTMDLFRVGHQVAVSAHGWLVKNQDRQRRNVEHDAVVEITPRLLRVSRAEEWTLHERHHAKTDPLPAITMIDLVLAESVAKRLVAGQRWMLRSAPKDIASWNEAAPWRGNSIASVDATGRRIRGEALRAIGPITSSSEKDWAMLDELKALHAEIRGT